jgi:hypothetical protein
MEQALRQSSIPKRDWFVGWCFYKATTQSEAADTFHELRLYFRNRNMNYYHNTDDDTDDDTEDETDEETDEETEDEEES